MIKIKSITIIFRGLFPWIEVFKGEERLFPRGFTRWEKRKDKEWREYKKYLNEKYPDEIACG